MKFEESFLKEKEKKKEKLGENSPFLFLFSSTTMQLLKWL